MIIDVRSQESVFITIGTETYYIDNSTGEHIMDHWNNEIEYCNDEYENIWQVQTKLKTNR